MIVYIQEGLGVYTGPNCVTCILTQWLIMEDNQKHCPNYIFDSINLRHKEEMVMYGLESF